MRKHRPKRRPAAIVHLRPMPIVGVGWYTEPEWSSVKAAAADPERFEDSFKEWVVVAEEALGRIRVAGLDPHKVMINSSELLAWCLAHGRVNDGPSRAAFVAEKVRIQSKGGA